MIRSFKNKALKRFWEKNDPRGINPNWLERVSIILDRLDGAITPRDMDLPGLRFHARHGKEKGRYQVDLTGGWRVTFEWQDQDATKVDMVEDHRPRRRG